VTSLAVGSTQPSTRGRVSKRELRALFSGTLGNTIEYYEFSLYGLAAVLVFPKIFFSEVGATAGTLLSLTTFIVAYVARPFGGLVLGHFGDKLGRKRTLIAALMIMGIATACIGLLPTYGQVGLWAPVLLVVLRVIQGISIGGEWSGSVLMALEHAHPGRRTFFGALIASGLAWGTLIANGAFLLISQLPEEDFLAWGWRLPFLFSALLVGLCLYIRIRLDESPEFKAVVDGKTDSEPAAIPVLEVVRKHRLTVLLVLLLIPGLGMTYFLATVFSLTYATWAGLDRTTMLTGIIVAQFVLGIGTPLIGLLADKTGKRRPILLVSFIGIACASWAWFALVNTASTSLILLGFAILFAPYAAAYATMPATIGHVFPTAVRFTGVALGYNLGTMLGSATSPLIAAALLVATGSWIPVAVYMTLGALIALGAAFGLRERYVVGGE
jgi:MFS family permease